MEQPSLFDAPIEAPKPPDQAARDFAVDPAHLVVLEASAGTGKTRVLVDRYVRLLEAGVDPRHILAVTFTRKAAAEMRERVLAELRRNRMEAGPSGPARTPGLKTRPPSVKTRPPSVKTRPPSEVWLALRDRIADIQISTIDAFCYGLLREFPLEADVDPGFEIADETEMGRFANEALDLTLRATRGLVATDECVRLLFMRVKAPILRGTLADLLDRRHVLRPAIASYVRRAARCAGAAEASAAFMERLRTLVRQSPQRAAILDDGPAASAEFRWLRADLNGLAGGPDEGAADGPAKTPQLRRRLERYFLTKDFEPRKRIARAFSANQFASTAAKKRHEAAVASWSPVILEALTALDADISGLLARGLERVFAIAAGKYEQLLDEHALMDFAGMLDRSVALLARQEEFARSRLKLQSRYHHVLVDEFQDTSRAQWRLVELLIDAWGEGEGVSDAPTSIFVVGDRKQSIYRFRHAEATLLDEAARKIGGLRPGRPVRQAITHSFRAVPELLAFVNALSSAIRSDVQIPERFQYGETDRFLVPAVAPGALRDGVPVLGAIAEPGVERTAAAVAEEIERLLAGAVVRDRSGLPRRARPDDIAILFRARAGHQYFEDAIEARGIRTYVYKGLGFFDAPEVQDVQALLRYLAQPESDLRAAEVLRSRLVRVSDTGLARLAPAFAGALRSPGFGAAAPLDDLDRALLDRARAGVARWLALADRMTPGELIDLILQDAAYAFELRGPRLAQARENLKKVRGLVRRVESRGYATLGRLADYFETLRAGDESNAIVEASGCVSLMTIHAAKGLEFPIVFLVNLHAGGRGRPSGFTIVERGPTGESDVAFGTSDATRLEDLRDEEELRRLLYVGLTRARDRLYFTAAIDTRGRLGRGPRSLAALLPRDLSDAIASAAVRQADLATWDSPHGAFTFRMCRPSGVEPSEGVGAIAPAADPGFDRGLLSVGQRTIVSATARMEPGVLRPRETASAPGSEDPGLHPVSDDHRLTGTLVHRLFQRQVPPSWTETDVAALVLRMVRPEELVDVEDPGSLAAAAAETYLSLRRREDVAECLASGRAEYEVPFSFQPPDRPAEIVRGTIDCVVAAPDGTVTILEFKTGAPRPEHEAQAAMYKEALSAALPGLKKVTVKILYP